MKLSFVLFFRLNGDKRPNMCIFIFFLLKSCQNIRCECLRYMWQNKLYTRICIHVYYERLYMCTKIMNLIWFGTQIGSKIDTQSHIHIQSECLVMCCIWNKNVTVNSCTEKRSTAGSFKTSVTVYCALLYNL